MFYEESAIDEVRARNDIVDVISESVTLERRGANYFGLCPFHNEKTPSFSVSPAKQMFYCFGCGAGGNVFSFVQKYENLTWPEAVERLAERAGYQLPVKGDAEKARRTQDKKKRLLEINKEAAVWFFYRLKSEDGKKAHAYLADRGLTEETIRLFGLGYAPLTQDALCQHLREKGFSDAEIADAGVAVKDDKGRLRDKFWNRVMFPIQDVNKRVIGFGGRVMGEGEPKYLNSPETLIFDKSRNLYGLMYARLNRKGRIILCEGYMDVIAMHQAGFTEAAASLGTSFTAGQAAVLKRYTDEVYLAYDADEAGTRAALRGIKILKEAGLRARIVRLAPYKDPDELIKAEGAPTLDRRVREAENPFFFEVTLAEKDYALSDPEEATRFQHLIAEKIAQAFPEPMERENYLQAICARYHIDPQAMKDLVARMEGTAGRKSADRQVRRSAAKSTQSAVKAQQMLVSWMAEEEEIFDVASTYLSPEDFTDPLCNRIAAQLYADREKGDVSPAALIDRFDDEEREQAAAVLSVVRTAAETRSDRERALHDMIYQVMERAYDVMCEQVAPDDASYLTRAVEGKKKLDTFKRRELNLS